MAGTQIDTILFDLDGTICDYRRDGADILDIAFEQVGVEPCFSLSDYIDRLDTLEYKASTFAARREQCFVSLAREAGLDTETGQELVRVYATERDQTNVEFCPGGERALRSLKEDHALGLVTNGGPDIQPAKLSALGIEDWFDTIVYAGYETAAKPDPEPFEHALTTLDSTSDRSVHIGNSLAADVAGAQRAGLTSVWIDNGADPVPEPDFAIDSLADLAEPPWYR